ncbi:hypothetical protein AX15_002265 [Amanita polypyramis BW_CC]|nr:hypothetical protein AX15_002265 [Amanita polypyramis BW_CC]
MLGVGSVVGFFVGNINLPVILPFLGKSQLEVLSVVVSLLLFAGHAVMALLVQERVLLQDGNFKARRKTFTGELKDIWSGMFTLPPVIGRICMIQFFAWLAWFPLLFYTTIYIGDLYKHATLASSTLPLSDEESSALDAEATRLGSRALFYSSLVTLFCNIALPFFVSEAQTTPGRRKSANRTPTRFTERFISLRAPRKMQVHLGNLWAFGHLVLAGCMFGTFLTSSVSGATLLITITGFSWAVSQWVPFSLLGKAILTEPDPADARLSITLVNTRIGDSEDVECEAFLPESGNDPDIIDENTSEYHSAKMSPTPVARSSQLHIGNSFEGESQNNNRYESNDKQTGRLSSKAGIILGIHNIFIVIPQFLITGVSAVVFAIFDHGASDVASNQRNESKMLTRGNEGIKLDISESSSVVYILRFGGFAAIVACILCWRLTRELKRRGL